VKADLSKVEEEEAKFDFKIFDISLDNSEFIDIRKLETEVSVPKFEDVSDVLENDFVIDIRSPNEVEISPIKEKINANILEIPFFKMETVFPTLEQNKNYLLYCKHGVMSRMVAYQLYKKGYSNFKILILK
ncbi:MAG: thiazole biosynthesis protein, partial [Psittacicella sp.]